MEIFSYSKAPEDEQSTVLPDKYRVRYLNHKGEDVFIDILISPKDENDLSIEESVKRAVRNIEERKIFEEVDLKARIIKDICEKHKVEFYEAVQLYELYQKELKYLNYKEITKSLDTMSKRSPISIMSDST